VQRGEKITARVVDGDGKPVPWISVTAPPTADPGKQPNFVYTTDKEGRFESDGLPPGTYNVTVGGIYRTEDGKRSYTAVKDAPGVYIPIPVVIRQGHSVPELTLRPVESVRFTARLYGPLPDADPAKVRAAEVDPAALAAAYKDEPAIGVKGIYHGVEWASQYSLSAGGEEPGTYTVLVPKGLTDATLVFMGLVHRFRLDSKSPELIGQAYRLGKVDADRLDIQVRAYRSTIISVVADAPRPGEIKVTIRYLREAEMQAAGVVFDPSPARSPGPDGKLLMPVLPGEDLEIAATGPDNSTANVRVRLTEGETREIPLRLSKKQ
jgi:carboxypeptidase family protein